LQHGALPLYGDLTRIISALKFQDETAKTRAKDRLLAHATTVENELGQLITWQQASHAFQQAFSEILNLDLEPGNLSTTEIQRAQDLQSSKYGHPSWTERI